MLMLVIIACLFGVFALLVFGNILSEKKIIAGEYQRKFVHMTVGTFVASWPWLMGWTAIALIGLLMLLVVHLNRSRKFFKFTKNIKRTSYGDYLFALAITACALLTTNKIFFAIAILHLALADGLAAIIGKEFGASWKYKVLRQTKTILGSMTFWFVSLYILGTGMLFAHDSIGFSGYAVMLLVLPPILTLLESYAVKGLDNIVIPVVVIIALRLTETI
jgi:dolichol kinase